MNLIQTKKCPDESGHSCIRCPLRELQLFNGTNLILIDAGLFAIQLFEFVEARILVLVWRVDGLDFATVVQGDYCR